MQPSGTPFILQFVIESPCPSAGCAARSWTAELHLCPPHVITLLHMKSLLVPWPWRASAHTVSFVTIHLGIDPCFPFPCSSTVAQTAQPHKCMPGGQASSEAPVLPTPYQACWPEPAECHLAYLPCSLAHCFVYWISLQNTSAKVKPEARKLVQLVKTLLWKHEDLSLISSIQRERLGVPGH